MAYTTQELVDSDFEYIIKTDNFIYIDVNCVILESLLESINIFKMLSEDLIYLSGENFKDERFNNLKSLQIFNCLKLLLHQQFQEFR